jgi:hypothetical protein
VPPGARRWAASASACRGAGKCSSECHITMAAHPPSQSAKDPERTSGRLDSRSNPAADRPRRCRASSMAPSPEPTSSIGPGGLIASTHRAIRPRNDRKSRSPPAGKRPHAGRYHFAYAASSSSAVGDGTVVPAPHDGHRATRWRRGT